MLYKIEYPKTEWMSIWKYSILVSMERSGEEAAETERKRWLSGMLFCAVLLLGLYAGACADGTRTPPYDRVIIFGVDGAGAAVSKIDTPNFDRIFSEGCVTYEAKATVPTMSAQCWGAMFYGVRGHVHNTDNNTAYARHKFNDLYTSFFQLVKDAYPKEKVAAFANWNAITWGLIEWGKGVDVYPKKPVAVSREQITENLMAYLDKNSPRLLLVYCVDVDHAMHVYEYESQEYFDELKNTDEWIGSLYDNFRERGLLDNALVIFATDHGGWGIHHGGGSEAETNCTFAITGPGVEKHGMIKNMEHQDVAAIVLYALGVEQPEIMTGRIPEGIFPGIGGEERKADPFPEKLKQYGEIRAEKAQVLPLPSDLSEKLAYRQSFDDEEIKGLARAKRKTTGIIGDAVDLRESYLKTGVKLNMKWPGFSIGFWFRDDGEKDGDPVFVCDKNWASGNNKGFAIAKYENRIQVNIGGWGKNRKDLFWTLPEGYEGKWLHFLVTFDKESQDVRLYCDYEYAGNAKVLPKRYSDWFSKKEIIAGQDTSERYRFRASADMDDLMIFSKALTEEEIGELKDWYESCFSAAGKTPEASAGGL